MEESSTLKAKGRWLLFAQMKREFGYKEAKKLKKELNSKPWLANPKRKVFFFPEEQEILKKKPRPWFRFHSL